MSGKHRLGNPPAPATSGPKPPLRGVRKGALTVALAVVLTAATFGVTGGEPKGAADVGPLTAPPTATGPAPITDPPLLTPAFPHTHRSRLLRSQVLSTALATPQPVVDPIPSTTVVPVPVQPSTVGRRIHHPAIAYAPSPPADVFQPPFTAPKHHHSSRDLNHDGSSR